jgi:hypothetical protein
MFDRGRHPTRRILVKARPNQSRFTLEDMLLEVSEDLQGKIVLMEARESSGKFLSELVTLEVHHVNQILADDRVSQDKLLLESVILAVL